MPGNYRIGLLISFSLLTLSVNSQSIQTDTLDQYIEKLMKDFDVPGLSLAVVEGDSVVYLQGFGTRQLGTEQAVESHTLFGIGSITKSFTALTLAMLVDEGLLDWDDKVVDYLPSFALYDPYVTENFTVRDLLTHRSGLPSVSGGLLWYHSDFDRAEIISRLKYLQPVAGFREEVAYQNLMYVVAGEVVSAVSGMSWDAFLKENVFIPLKMNTSTSESEVREASANLARPHVYNEAFEQVTVEQEKGDNMAAGGFIYSSAREMANYMKLLLNKGVFEDDTLLNQSVIAELFTPQVLFPYGVPLGNSFTSYGLGWWLTPKNDYKVIEHGGLIDGMSAYLTMLEPVLERPRLGVLVLINHPSPAVVVLSKKITDALLQDVPPGFYRHFQQAYSPEVMAEKAAQKEAGYRAARIQNTEPSLQLSAYAGTYRDRMYGDILIDQQENGSLEIFFSHTPLFRGALSHWHHDTFRIEWYDLRIPDGFLTFSFNSDHAITGFSLDQPRLLDVNFEELKIKRVTEE